MPTTPELPAVPSGPLAPHLLAFTEITLHNFARWINAVALPEHGVQLNVEKAVADFLKLLTEEGHDDAHSDRQDGGG